MSLIILFISFFFACTGAWIFFDGFFAATTDTQEFYAAVSGLAWAVIPYMVGKTLAEMVAIRQRHMQLEHTAQFNYMMAEHVQLAEQNLAAVQATAAAVAESQQAAAAQTPQRQAKQQAPAAEAPGDQQSTKE